MTKIPDDFNSFNDYLYEIRESGISFEEAKQAKLYAEAIQDKIQSDHCLNQLKKEITKFGSNESKLFYSSGSELDMNILTKVLPEEKEYLKHIFQGFNLTVSEFKKLTPDNQQRLQVILKKAYELYLQSAMGKNSSHTSENEIAEQINNFVTYTKL